MNDLDELLFEKSDNWYWCIIINCFEKKLKYFEYFECITIIIRTTAPKKIPHSWRDKLFNFNVIFSRYQHKCVLLLNWIAKKKVYSDIVVIHLKYFVSLVLKEMDLFALDTTIFFTLRCQRMMRFPCKRTEMEEKRLYLHFLFESIRWNHVKRWQHYLTENEKN